MILICFHLVKKLDDVIVKQSTRMSVVKRSSSLTNLVDRQSSSSNSPSWAISSQTNVSPLLGQEQCFYCYYCGKPCNSQTQLELHCSSPRHILNVNSDNDKQWNFHQPPWNVQNGNYRLCIQLVLEVWCYCCFWHGLLWYSSLAPLHFFWSLWYSLCLVEILAFWIPYDCVI